MKTKTSKTTRIHVSIELEDAEAIESWPGFSYRGKRVQPEWMAFEVIRRDGRPDYVGPLSVGVRVYRKDGTLGSQHTDIAVFQWHEQLERADKVLEELFRPLLAVARSEVQEVLAR